MPCISTEAEAGESGRGTARRPGRHEAEAIRRAIDAALVAGTPPPPNELREWCRNLTVTALAERVRQRAAQLTRQTRAGRAALIEARDAVILAVHAHTAANVRLTAWRIGWRVPPLQEQCAGPTPRCRLRRAPSAP